MRLSKLIFSASACLINSGVHGEDGSFTPGEPRNIQELPVVNIVATSPLAGTGLELNKAPGNYQIGDSADLYRNESFSLGNYLSRNLESVNVNEVMNNPYQPDISFRGFSASPILGTPIGMSVYQDGVRVNEAFGDTVNWDLIPRFAIDHIELIPGSNPMFGLNTLGGSLLVRTKNGFTHRGTRFQGEGGSFGRLTGELQHGGSAGNFDWFLGGSLFGEQGWRDYSRSSVKQGFAKIGWDDERTDIDLSYTYADNSLTGNGAAPESLIAADRTAVYAHPERTSPRLHMVDFKINHWFSDHLEFTGNAFYRSLNQDVFAADIEVEAEDDGEFDAEPTINRAATRSIGTGGTAQLSYSEKLADHENYLTAGFDYVNGDTRFSQDRQDGELTVSRGVEPEGDILPITRLRASNDYYGLFLSDTFSVTPWWHVTGSGRWTKADIRLDGKGVDLEGESTSLSGRHQFNRINPSAGFTLEPMKALEWGGPLEDMTFYGNYSEGFRVPTPAELSCADPQEPCALPTNFASDPPLKPIVAHTFETGFRGTLYQEFKWHASWYLTDTDNEILFSNAPGTQTRGFFQNVRSTRREGVELGLSGRHEKLSWFLNYTFIEATYRTHTILENGIGPVEVRSGDQIPGVPSQLVKAGFDLEVLPDWHFGGDLQYVASQYLRGDDNNRFKPLSEYVILNINTRYQIHKNVELYALARNLTDEQYNSFGLVGRSALSEPVGKVERFVSPGAPIGAWAGFRITF